MTRPLLRELLEKAAVAYQSEDFDTAEIFAAKACKANPRSLDAWDFHSLVCQSMGDPIAATRSCKKALALARSAWQANPLDDKLALRQIFLLMRLGEDGEIERLFTELIERHPGHPRIEQMAASWRLRPR